MTGKMGLVRNLTAAEILAQVFFAREAVRKHEMVSGSLPIRSRCHLVLPKILPFIGFGFSKTQGGFENKVCLPHRLLPT